MVRQTCGKRQLCRELGALLLAAAGFGAAAQPALPPRDLVVSSTLERIAASDPSAALPGPLVVSVRFTNATPHVIDSVRITSPIPEGTAYVPQSASGPGSEVLFSIDDGRTFGRPDELVIAGDDGATRGADPSTYTHVRWILRAPLDTGASGVARFRAVPR